MSIRPKRNWTREMDTFLYNNYPTMPMKLLVEGINALYFGDPIDNKGVQYRAKVLGLYGQREAEPLKKGFVPKPQFGPPPPPFILKQLRAAEKGEPVAERKRRHLTPWMTEEERARPKRDRSHRSRAKPDHLLTRARPRSSEEFAAAMAARKQRGIERKLKAQESAEVKRERRIARRRELAALERGNKPPRPPREKQAKPPTPPKRTKAPAKPVTPPPPPKPVFSILAEVEYTEAEQRILAKHEKAKTLLRAGGEVDEIARTVGLEGRVVRQLIGEIRREKYQNV